MYVRMYVCMFGFLVLCFPVIPSALPLFSFVPFIPFHFPLLSCHVDFLFPPLISFHFLTFPLCSQYFPQKTWFFQRFRKEDVQKHRVFPDCGQKEAVNPNQQKSWQGESSLGPLFCDSGSPISGTSSNHRAVRGPPHPPPPFPGTNTPSNVGGLGDKGPPTTKAIQSKITQKMLGH